MSNIEFDISPLYCVSLTAYTWLGGFNYSEIELQTLEDKQLTLSLENTFRGVISSVMGNRYVKSRENKKVMYIDANNLYGSSMSESLTFDEIKFDLNVKVEDILNTPDDSDVGYFVEVH